MTYFVNTYLVCCLRHGIGKSLKRNTISNVFSISDIAFVLWLLENNWDHWTDMKNNGNTKKSMVKTKYTITGESGGSNKYSGWNELGKKQYNDLFEIVESKIGSPACITFEVEFLTVAKGNATTTKSKGKSNKADPLLDADGNPMEPLKVCNSLSTLASSVMGVAALSGKENTPPPPNSCTGYKLQPKQVALNSTAGIPACPSLEEAQQFAMPFVGNPACAHLGAAGPSIETEPVPDPNDPEKPIQTMKV